MASAEMSNARLSCKSIAARKNCLVGIGFSDINGPAGERHFAALAIVPGSPHRDGALIFNDRDQFVTAGATRNHLASRRPCCVAIAGTGLSI